MKLLTLNKALKPVKDIEYDPKELKLGIKVELEHTKDRSTAENIAKHHLAEHPHYYSNEHFQALQKEEKEMKKSLAEQGINTITGLREKYAEMRKNMNLQKDADTLSPTTYYRLAKGGERAGHKYYKRVPKSGGKGYTYYYTKEEWNGRNKKKTERVDSYDDRLLENGQRIKKRNYEVTQKDAHTTSMMYPEKIDSKAREFAHNDKEVLKYHKQIDLIDYGKGSMFGKMNTGGKIQLELKVLDSIKERGMSKKGIIAMAENLSIDMDKNDAKKLKQVAKLPSYSELKKKVLDRWSNVFNNKAHELLIERAVKDGKPVPSNVLIDYKDKDWAKIGVKVNQDQDISKSFNTYYTSLTKGKIGEQKAGAKYYKREPKSGGGYKYYYTKEQYMKDKKQPDKGKETSGKVEQWDDDIPDKTWEYDRGNSRKLKSNDISDLKAGNILLAEDYKFKKRGVVKIIPLPKGFSPSKEKVYGVYIDPETKKETSDMFVIWNHDLSSKKSKYYKTKFNDY